MTNTVTKLVTNIETNRIILARQTKNIRKRRSDALLKWYIDTYFHIFLRCNPVAGPKHVLPSTVHHFPSLFHHIYMPY